MCHFATPLVQKEKKKGSQERMEIYVGYDSHSNIHYLEPLTDDIFTAHFADCHFYETVFSPLGEDKNINVPTRTTRIIMDIPTMSHLEPNLDRQSITIHFL